MGRINSHRTSEKSNDVHCAVPFRIPDAIMDSVSTHFKASSCAASLVPADPFRKPAFTCTATTNSQVSDANQTDVCLLQASSDVLSVTRPREGSSESVTSRRLGRWYRSRTCDIQSESGALPSELTISDGNRSDSMFGTCRFQLIRETACRWQLPSV